MEPLILEDEFGLLKKAKERPQNSSPNIKIRRVANHLRNRKHLEKHYSPKFLSIGPIHHGDVNLKVGEQYKLMWAAMYIENTGRNPKDLHKRIADNIEQLMGLFAEDVLTDMSSFNHWEERLSWVLFVDGCALLHILEKAKLNEPDQMNVKVDQLVLVMMDVLLLENQIPYLVLKLLWRDDNDESALILTMKNFLKWHHWSTEKNNNNNNSDQSKQSTVVEVEFLEPECAHLLDLQRIIILPADSRPKGRKAIYDMDELPYAYIIYMEELNNVNNSRKNSSNVTLTFRNIQDLRATGIRLKSSKTDRPRDISFFHGWFGGELTLPEIVVNDTTAATFLNLIAYEICPDFENDYGFYSFAGFMASLIDHPEDVKALRSAGILINSLWSDEEVSNLFNTISTDLVPTTQVYYEVRVQIEKYYKKKWKTWIALGYHTHFSNPWAIIAFLAALLALILTFIQTWFAIHPVG